MPPKPGSPRGLNWFRHGIDRLVRSNTEAAVARQTDWDRRGWEWCTIDREDRVSVGDFVLLFEYLNNQAWARVVLVKGTTRTGVPTPDGRFFFAYAESRRRFRRKKVTKAFFNSLAAAGWRLRKQESQDTRRLSQHAISAVGHIFKRQDRLSRYRHLDGCAEIDLLHWVPFRGSVAIISKTDVRRQRCLTG